ncbi:hypothetical protein ABEF95_008616 [Exophiala dermatitidis]
MPTTLVSTSTLEWIGFTTATAAEICHRYQTRPDPRINPDSLLDYVEGHIVQLQLPAFRNTPPAQALEKVGIRKSVQDALLDPDFSALLYTRDLHYWLTDTLTTNYATLIRLRDRLRNHANAIRSVAWKKQKRDGLPQQLQSMASLAASASSSAPGTHELVPEVSTSQKQDKDPRAREDLGAQIDEYTGSAILTLTPEDHDLPVSRIQLLTEEQEPGAVPPDYTALYKGKAASDDPDGPSWIQDDGSGNLAMTALSTLPGGDFHWWSCAHCWTPGKETAEYYRSWAARRCPYAETWLVRILISAGFVDALRKARLFYHPISLDSSEPRGSPDSSGADWKEYVWHCKKGMRPPPKFDYLWKEGPASAPGGGPDGAPDGPPAGVDVIQGHICTGNTGPITRIPAHEVHARITKENVLQVRLRVGNTTTRKATQWAFIHHDIIDRLGEEITSRGGLPRIHIDITASTMSRQF